MRIFLIHSFDYDSKDLSHKSFKDLRKLIKKNITKEHHYDPNDYGGPLARKLYAAIEPHLLDYFYQICLEGKYFLSTDPAHHPAKAQAFFDYLLDVMGDHRHHIAIMTGTRHGDLFGSRIFNKENPLLMDVFYKDKPWPDWYTTLQSKVDHMIKGQKLADLFFDADNAENGIAFEDEGAVLQITSTGSGLYNVYFHASTDLPYPDAFQQKNPRLGDSSAAYYWVVYGFNEHSIFPLPDYPSQDRMIRCYHRSAWASIINDGFEDFLTCLLWSPKTSTPQDLTKSLASLLWRMAHSSTYQRGQAMITKWLLKTLARINGFDLHFAKETEAYPNMPNEDQLALSFFDRQNFIDECLKNGFFQLIQIQEETSIIKG